MGKNYYQLNFDERIELDRLRDAGCSKRKISRIMGRSHTTISWQLRRNALPIAGYKPARAQIMAKMRCERTCRLQRESQLRQTVHDQLAMGWSPEQIAGRLGLGSMFNRPRRHLITGITTIGKEFGYGGKTVQRAGYDVAGLVAILNARIMNFAKQQIALSINAYMAFAALYFLARIIAGHPAGFARLHTLAVNNCRRRLHIAARCDPAGNGQ